jgi:acylphosphatase
MGFVKAEVTNKSGGKVTLTLDEDDERIEYFKKLVKRDELEAVKFSKVAEKSTSGNK